ncbi:MAG TPA: ECF-type sigma factor [Rhodanobacteraceae bacterium]|nr:ECF-type sigma factor [Rhodanobacteraceae bacterium]
MTQLLGAVEQGDAAATDRVFGLLYDELRQCARRQRHGAGETISTTALVHETYVKLTRAGHLHLEGKRHFMALAARAMRQVLVDHARRAGAEKRGGGLLQVTLNESLNRAPDDAVEVLALDQALADLEKIDERAARVVQLHFFAGLTFAAIGELEGLTERTIKRDWDAARRLLAASMRATH